MLSFLAPKGLRAEVTEGIDLEQSVLLTGARVTIGSGPDDDLRLGAADVVQGHLTLERRADGTGWDYFASDRGVTNVSSGNPRTGQVRPGLAIMLGRETRIELIRTVLPAGEAAADDGVPTTVPLPVAIGILGALAIVAAVFLGGFGGNANAGLSLQTTSFVTAPRAIEQALETCLADPRSPHRSVTTDDPASAFWQVMAFRETDPARANSATSELADTIRGVLTDAHLLAREGKPLEASATLRRLEYVLPLGGARCPILAASRFDLALLELRGSR